MTDLWENRIAGKESGDIFTIGISGGYYLETGISFDRIVMNDGTPDWFFTWGTGATTPGLSISFDKGKIGELDLIDSTGNYLTKQDIEGFSLSSNADFFVIGFEGSIAPFNSNANGKIGYPSPVITRKGGVRVFGLGVNFFGNWTWDIGN